MWDRMGERGNSVIEGPVMKVCVFLSLGNGGER